MPSRILITGATGFLGSEIFCRLVKKTDPENLVLLGRRVPDLEKGLLADRMRDHGVDAALVKRVRFVHADFMDEAAFRSALEGLEGRDWTVVHLAALIHSQGEKKVQDRVNTGVTRDLLEWLNSRGGHFVYASSMVAFGGTKQGIFRSERDFGKFPRESRGFDYFTSKRDAHNFVEQNAKVPVTMLCPGIVHGRLEHYKDSRSHLKALREGTLKLAPSGGCNLVALDHVARSFVEAALDPNPPAKKLWLLVDKNLSYRDYFALYVSLARGSRAQRIKMIPAWIGPVARTFLRIFSLFGLYSSSLEGLAQGSLFLYFRSERGQAGGTSLEDSIRASLRK
ncbi:MAG: NAD-dependent epimerase/dehydratase family protein [Bdellovibrionales bacterium]|nr:NAD-dependent epimerase/dehydratase family protein [Bdellovibrionales bacterium]